MIKTLFKKVPINSYFKFVGSNQVWYKLSPRLIRKIGEVKATTHIKNDLVFLIGDMEKAMSK